VSAPEENGRPARGGAALLAAAAVVSAVFAFSFWGRNAEGLGAHDMGLALFFSFAVPVTLYLSLALAAVALAAAVAARVRGGRPARYVVALAVALIPLAVLVIADLV
jgi:hypothetical protein